MILRINSVLFVRAIRRKTDTPFEIVSRVLLTKVPGYVVKAETVLAINVGSYEP